jgi:hypothetical protein
VAVVRFGGGSVGVGGEEGARRAEGKAGGAGMFVGPDGWWRW